MDPHEEGFVRAFLLRRYRERCLAKGGLAREDLWHDLEGKLDPRRVLELPNNVHLPARWRPVIEALTQARAGVCLSARRELDGARLELAEDADLEGTIVSFEAGELALFQGEFCDPTFRRLLVRDPARRRRAEALLARASEDWRRRDRAT